MNTEEVNYVDKDTIYVEKYMTIWELLDLPLRLRAHADESGGKSHRGVRYH